MSLRRVRWVLVGSVLLVALAGCGRSILQYAQREPWRKDAEVACVKSGASKERPGRVRIEPIEGPGVCGAEFPLKIAALGEGSAFGFAGEAVRPPGAIPGGARGQPQLRWPVAVPARSAPAPQPLSEPRLIERASSGPGGEPLELSPGGPPSISPPETTQYPQRYGAPPAYPQAEPNFSHAPVRTADEFAVPALGPERSPRVTGSVAVEVKPQATLACPIVNALDRWVAEAVQPAAQKWFGQPVVELRQISAYSCRGMNGQVGARISEHAFGNALDIAAFVLADGRRIVIKSHWNGTAEEQAFLHDVQAAACETFTTVLAPGSNRFHYDHIHVDLMRRASGRRICQPGAVDGEVVAARVRGQPNYAVRLGGGRPVAGRAGPIEDPYAVRRADAMPTGSIGKRKTAAARSPVDDDDDWVEDDGPRTSIEDLLREPQAPKRRR